MNKKELENRFNEVAPNIYCWTAPEAETFETMDFFIDKMIQINSKHTDFSVIIDINAQLEPLPSELGKHFFKRHTSANLVFLKNFCVLTTKPNLTNRIIMKLGSKALGFKALYFKDLETCIEKLQSYQKIPWIKKIKNYFFNFMVFMDQNNDSTFHVNERFIRKAHNYLLFPFLLVAAIFIPYEYQKGIPLTQLIFKSAIALLPAVVILLKILLKGIVPFEIRRVFLPIGLAIQSGMLISSEDIVLTHPYILTYSGIAAIALAWFFVSIKQLLLVVFVAILSLVIGNHIGELFELKALIHILLVYLVIGPLAFFARLIYNKSESDFYVQHEQLVQNNKLTQMGKLNASIAHEINNPLAIISGNASYIRKTLQRLKNENPDLEETLNNCLAKIEKQNLAIKRINNIILTMRRFARKQTDHFKNFSIKQAFEETYRIIQDLYQRENIDFESQIELLDSNIQVFGEQEQIIQTITNLLTNASDAVKNEENKKVTLKLTQIDDQTVNIYVIDNGHGVAPELKSKIFEQFFSTKPPNAGGGMGLSLAQSMIEAHKGKLTFFANENGTTFVISLPISTYE